mmetsp:Transcript_79765/g.207320  ORF Transcript_79765/g.207320 Transcript_79765/m.207320 type:complete len:398 (+) Transcript_79765:94-1287(+)
MSSRAGDDGMDLGAGALFLGSLRRCKEVLVLDSAGAVVTPEAGFCSIDDRVAMDDDEVPPQHLIERDMTLDDCSSSDDEDMASVCDDFVHGTVSVEEAEVPRRPGDGRRMMQLRAQQCVVCLAEKEHTLVPPHHGVDVDGSEIEACHLWGHRFCTDCWPEFLLRHRDEQQQRISRGSRKSQPLQCPVCRRGIGVPDAWRVHLDIPVVTGSSSPKASRTSAAAARCHTRRGRPRHTSASQCHSGAPAFATSAFSAPTPTEADDATASDRQFAQEEGSPQFWAHRRAGPGAAWAASKSAITGPPVIRDVVRDGHALVADDWVVPPFWRVAVFWFEVWKMVLTVLLCTIGYVSALFAAAEVAASIVGDDRHPGMAPLLVDAWDFAAMLAAEFAQQDGYSD